MAANTLRMITVPSKKPFELNITQPLRTFIQQTYTANLDDYLKSVDSLNQLRNEALFKCTRQEKLTKMMRYYDQLTAIETKIPISENQIRLSFKWQDAFEKSSLFGRSTLMMSSSVYERLCVLFNIGACASEIAASQVYDQEDGLKTAAKYYNLAAGAFTYIRDNALTATRNDCTTDLYPETLTVLINTMLAQAQEIFYQKAVKDKMKESIISKLAAQCADFYSEAMKSIQSDNLRDLQKQWMPTLAGKQALHQAMAEYHKSVHENTQKNIGEELSRLGHSMELLKIADQRGGKEINVKPNLQLIQTALDKAKRENDYVYHDRVPEYKSLPLLDRAAAAKVTVIKFPISEDFRDLFVTLVPIAVHNGLQSFKAKRQEALNFEIGKLRQATELMNVALSTWNLPASIEDVGGSNKTPQSLIDKSQVIKDKGGISKIDSMMAELPPLLQCNSEILAETKRNLVEEETSDTALKVQLKDKWTRTPSGKLTDYLHTEIRQYETIMDNAVKANKVIETKYRQHRDGIQLLSRTPNEISTSLPAATAAGALQKSHVIIDLRRLMDEVEGLKNVREVIESEMKNVDSDAKTAKLISALGSSRGLDEHSIIQEELDEIVSPLRKQVRENIQEQEKLLGYIEKANNEYTREKVSNETSKMRDEMLKNLAAASDGYNELFNHLNEGIKFYNDLTPILLKFQNKVNDFVFARKTEKDDLMKDIQTNLSRPGGSSGPTRPPPPNDPSSQNPPTTNANHQQSQPPLYPGAGANSAQPQQGYFPPPMPNVYYPYGYQQQPSGDLPSLPSGGYRPLPPIGQTYPNYPYPQQFYPPGSNYPQAPQQPPRS